MHLGGLTMITMVLLFWPASSRVAEASSSSYHPRALVNYGSLNQHPILNFQEEEEEYIMAHPGIIVSLQSA